MNVEPASKKLDWHPADVLAALKKRGKTLAGLSRAHGYHATAAGKALKTPWPALEALIAAELGLGRKTSGQAGMVAPGNAAKMTEF